MIVCVFCLTLVEVLPYLTGVGDASDLLSFTAHCRCTLYRLPASATTPHYLFTTSATGLPLNKPLNMRWRVPDSRFAELVVCFPCGSE